LIEAAHKGTLLLDEIGDMSLALQQRLLRVLQEREVRRVGAVNATAVDVRVIAATHRDLRTEVAQGRFRDDLFYRLNVFTIALPPLRERTADIPFLVENALSALRAERRRLTCSPLAMRMLRAYGWPGNVRELLAALESAAIRADGERIDAQHLPAEIRAGRDQNGKTAERLRTEASPAEERASILAALERAEGNRSRAAEIMGIGRTTLWRKMRSYGIETDLDTGV
jgi:DNA-binding NtrC family response regulator